MSDNTKSKASRSVMEKINLYMDKGTLEEMKKAAKDIGCSFSSLIRDVCQTYVKCMSFVRTSYIHPTYILHTFQNAHLTQRSNRLDSPIKSTGSRATSDEGLQRLKKQKETILYNNSPFEQPNEQNEQVENLTQPKGPTKKSNLGPTEYTKEFELLWSEYPRKENKKRSFETFQDYYSKELFSIETLLAVLKKVSRESWTDRETKFIPICTTWLNRRPWEDVQPVKVEEEETIERLEFLVDGWGKKLKQWHPATGEYKAIAKKLEELKEKLERRKNEKRM